MTGNVSGPKWQGVASAFAAEGITFGVLMGTKWCTPWTEHWACDNDMFAAHKRGDTGWWKREGETAWLKMLDKAASQPTKPLFVALPDVVEDWPRTVARAWYYLPELRSRSLPPAIVLQDGCHLGAATMLSCPWWFVGGSDAYKWGQLEEIVRTAHLTFDTKVHVGRVNGTRQVRSCLRAGADSCDGTGLAAFTNTVMPRLVAGFKPNPQGALFQ